MLTAVGQREDGLPVRSLRSGHPILSALAYVIGCVIVYVWLRKGGC